MFLAERTGWGATEVREGEEEKDEEEEKQGEGGEGEEGEQEGTGKGREVVEWLLGCKAGEKLEKGVGGEDGDEMEGVVETGKGKEKEEKS